MQTVISKDFIITTERCLLRCPSEEDIPHIFSATRFDGFNDGMLWEPPATIDELYKPLQNSLLSWDTGTAFTFTIIAQQSKDFLGRISIRKCEGVNVWDVGFWTHPIYQNQGYMTEALEAVLNFGFTQLEATRIEACHALWNRPSQLVLKKVGMKFLEYLPEGFHKKGQWIEENRLGIKKVEWLTLHFKK
jgi:[ribosomal protein S5]-alanine N-acetyltransferase